MQTRLDHHGIYETVIWAKKAYPNWVSATKMRDLVRDQYNVDLHPIHIGDAGKHHQRTIRFYKGRGEGATFGRKVGHLYNPDDVAFYAWMLHLKVAERCMEIVNTTLLETLDPGDGGYHRHHIIPKHAGGTNDKSNIIKLTVFQHAMAHKRLYEEYGRNADLWAWRRLIFMCRKSFDYI